MDQFFTEQRPDPVSSDQESHNTRRIFVDMLQTLLLSAAIFLALNFISARIRIESVSMQPTLYENDFVLVNRLAYKMGQPGRGDVIVFHYPPNPEQEPYIKRVIGLPGDTVEVRDGLVFVNGNLIREPYIKNAPAYSGVWQVPQDSLFVLGDNRNNSSDSHAWGFVPLQNVIGTAEFVYLPPAHWQVLNPSQALAAEPQP